MGESRGKKTPGVASRYGKVTKRRGIATRRGFKEGDRALPKNRGIILL